MASPCLLGRFKDVPSRLRTARLLLVSARWYMSFLTEVRTAVSLASTSVTCCNDYPLLA